MSVESLSHSPAPAPRNSWPGHFAATLKLGLPIIGAHLAQLAIGTTDTIMIGWLGATELAASVLASQAFFILLMLGSGFAQAIMPIVAQAEGKNDVRGARRATRMGLWIAVGYTALCMVPLWFLEPILLFGGQEPDVARIAGSYMAVMQWSLFPAMIAFVLRSFLVALERAQLMLWNTIAAAILNGLLNYALIFGNWGAPELGIVGAAIASVITTTFNCAVLLGYATLSRHLRRFELIVRIWRSDWPALFDVLRLGWPISLTIISEVGLFAASSVMMGWLGTIDLAAHGIALQLASVAFMIPLGLSGVATVRVGQAVGRGDRVGLDRAAKTVLFIALSAGVVSALLFWVIPERLALLFLDRSNPDSDLLLAYAAGLLLVAAAFQLVDSLQGVAVGLLRGLKDTRTPMIIAIISYWGIGMPVAYVLAFVAGFGGAGIWLGLAFGLSAAAILLSVRFFRLAPSAI